MTALLPILTLLITLLSFTSCNNEKINWTNLTSLRIYDYKTYPEGKNIYTFSDKDIAEMNFIETDIEETREIFQKSILLKYKTYLWKGHHFAIATFSDGQKRRIKISVYGGFFMDLMSKEYYQLIEGQRQEWNTFFAKYYSFLHKQNETDCDKCDIVVLKKVNDNLNALTYEIVNSFLCTFDTTCKNNVEYSQWSNELLFRVLENSPLIFLEVAASKQINNELILNEIKSPLLYFNLQIIYDNLKATSELSELKTKYLEALLIAAQYDGQEIKK